MIELVSSTSSMTVIISSPCSDLAPGVFDGSWLIGTESEVFGSLGGIKVVRAFWKAFVMSTGEVGEWIEAHTVESALELVRLDFPVVVDSPLDFTEAELFSFGPIGGMASTTVTFSASMVPLYLFDSRGCDSVIGPVFCGITGKTFPMNSTKEPIVVRFEALLLRASSSMS